MNDHVPFLKAILERPDDPGPLGVYSDWLEELGDTSLAEYVRLCRELLFQPPLDPSACPNTNRRKKLWRRYRMEWLGSIAASLGQQAEYEDDRPFCFFFTCTTAYFLMRLSRDAGSPRIPHCWGVQLHDLDEQFDEFVDNPHLEWITRLSLNLSPLTPMQLEHLVNCDGLRNLRTLHTNGVGVGDAGCRAISQSRKLPRLRRLTIADDRMSEAGLHALLDSRRLPSLVELDLFQNAFLGRTPPPLKYSSRQPRLTLLRIRDTPWGDSILAWLARWPGLSSIQLLDLERAGLGPAGIEALTRSPHLTGLRTLILAHNHLGDDGIRILAESPLLGQLDTLNVNHCDIGSTGALAFLAAPVLPSKVVMMGNPNLGSARRRLMAQPARFLH